MITALDIALTSALEKTAADKKYVPQSIREGQKFEKMVRRGYAKEKARLKAKHGVSGAMIGGLGGAAAGAAAGALRGKGYLPATLIGAGVGGLGGLLAGRARGGSEARARREVVKAMRGMSAGERAEFYRRSREEKLRERSARAQELLAGVQAAHTARQWPRVGR